MIWTLPNILTVFRLCAALALPLAFVILPRPYADWIALALFVCAAATDWIDGYIARAWNQGTRIGTMLDPIADKAMVLIALMVIVGYSAMGRWILLPAAIILFREVFVSGLREYLGDTAGTLKVTRLAKWKTAVQMVAITALFGQGLFEHYAGMAIWGMDAGLVSDILDGRVEDTQNLVLMVRGLEITGWSGVALLWLAALLTFVTGWDYFRKTLPYVKEDG